MKDTIETFPLCLLKKVRAASTSTKTLNPQKTGDVRGVDESLNEPSKNC